MNAFKLLSRRLDQCATRFGSASVVYQMLARELLERASIMREKPQTLLDIGCKTGYMTQLFQEALSGCRVVGLEASNRMLQVMKDSLPDLRSTFGYYSDLPFQDESFDWVVSHLACPWVADLGVLFQECYRVLKPGGLFLFSTLGPATTHLKAPSLVDMHHIGDALLSLGFEDSVMDVDQLQVEYEDQQSFEQDCIDLGIGKGACERSPLLNQESFSVTLEVIFGQTWRPNQMMVTNYDQNAEIAIPLSAIKRSLHGKY